MFTFENCAKDLNPHGFISMFITSKLPIIYIKYAVNKTELITHEYGQELTIFNTFKINRKVIQLPD